MADELARPKIKLQGRAARTHTAENPLKYQSEDGLKWEYEYRDLAELQRVKDQLIGKPVTLEHPEKLALDGGDLYPITIGVITDARMDGEEIVVDYEVELPLSEVQDLIKKNQLSLGYKSAMNQNRVQRLTEVDHMAMTERARGGATLETRMDSRAHFDAMDAPIAFAHAQNMPHTSEVTEPTLDETPKDSTMDETQTALQTKLDSANAEVTALKTKLDSAESEKQAAELAAREAKKDLEVLQSKFDAEIKVHKDAAEALKTEHEAAKAKMDSESKAHFDAEINARIDVLTAANEILPAPVEGEKPFIERDSVDLKCAIVAHVDGEDVSGKPPAWIDGCFAGARKRSANGSASVAAARVALATAHKDNADRLEQEHVNREAELKQKMQDASASQYTKRSN